MDARLVAGHRKRAAEHAASADVVKSQGGLHEWEIVMRFYSALRLLDAWLVVKGTPASSHEQRWQAVLKNSELSQGRGMAFKNAYRRLRKSSEDVRYLPVFEAQTTDIENCRKDLGVIQSFLVSKLDALLSLPPGAGP